MNNLLKVFLLGLACIPYAVKCEEVWSSETKIKILYPTSGSLIFMTDYRHNLSQCDNGTRFMLDTTAADYSVLASILIAAFMADKPIRFNFNLSQNPTCSPIVNRFMVFK